MRRQLKREARRRTAETAARIRLLKAAMPIPHHHPLDTHRGASPPRTTVMAIKLKPAAKPYPWEMRITPPLPRQIPGNLASSPELKTPQPLAGFAPDAADCAPACAGAFKAVLRIGSPPRVGSTQHQLVLQQRAADLAKRKAKEDAREAELAKAVEEALAEARKAPLKTIDELDALRHETITHVEAARTFCAYPPHDRHAFGPLIIVSHDSVGVPAACERSYSSS